MSQNAERQTGEVQTGPAMGGDTVEMLHGEETEKVGDHLVYRSRKRQWELYQVNAEIERQMRVADERDRANQQSYLIVVDGVSLVVEATHKHGRGEVVVDDVTQLWETER